MKRSHRLNRRVGWLALLTVWIVLAAAFPTAAEAVIPENVTVRNLSAILPERDETRWPLKFAFLSGNRLFAVSDRLTLIDSAKIELLVTAPLPAGIRRRRHRYLPVRLGSGARFRNSLDRLYHERRPG